MHKHSCCRDVLPPVEVQSDIMSGATNAQPPDVQMADASSAEPSTKASSGKEDTWKNINSLKGRMSSFRERMRRRKEGVKSGPSEPPG